MASINIPKTAADFNDAMTAWCAGIVDGEGHVSIKRASNCNAKIPVIAVKMTCQKTIETLGNYFGCGHFSIEPASNIRAKQCYKWKVGNRQAQKVALLLEPFCVTKKTEIHEIAVYKTNRELRGFTRVTSKLAREMRLARQAGESYQKIGKRLGVSWSCVADIAQRETWAEQDFDIPTAKPRWKRSPNGTRRKLIVKERSPSAQTPCS
jgi:hypothetical protein